MLVMNVAASIQTKLSYSSKVRAYPFAFSLEEALVQHGPTISVNAGGKDILQSLGARFLPGFGIKPIQPKQAKAVYLPAWIIDAEVEAKFWVRTAEDQEAGQVKPSLSTNELNWINMNM
ncbi:hypothetical protein QCA50_005804 [Cerrena zonata]|uniref:Uncharacterized protein n=1 Tax=Cerrena zonata TaxID=2478898 RepID=A0AAW0GBG7_9APHY